MQDEPREVARIEHFGGVEERSLSALAAQAVESGVIGAALARAAELWPVLYGVETCSERIGAGR